MKKSLWLQLTCVFLMILVAFSSLAVVLGSNKNVSTSEYDLNGDGKGDRVKVSFSHYDSDTISGYTVSINGKTYTLNDVFGYESKVEIVDVDTTDKYYELLISHISDSDHQEMNIFRWNGSKIEYLGSIYGGRLYPGDVKIAGDGVIVSYLIEDILGTFTRVQKYQLQTKSPWFKAVSQSVYDIHYSSQATVIRAFKAYASPKDESPRIQLKKGDELVRTGTDGEKWVRFKNTTTGKTVWIKAAKGEHEMYSEIAGYGSMYDYLSGIDFSG